MRELVIRKIVEYTSQGRYLEEEYNVHPDSLQNMSDVRLFNLLENIILQENSCSQS